MKKILVLTVLLVSMGGFAQIKKAEISKKETIGKVGSFGHSYDFLCEKIDNTYIFSYRDLNYQHLEEFKQFSFEDIDGAFNQLYTVIMEGFKNKPDEDVLLELPNGILKLHFVKALGVVNVNMAYNENGISGVSAWLTKRKVIKLFGKK